MSDGARLDAIIRDVLELEPGTDLSSVRYRATVTWDSVAHLQLIVGIEDAFGLVIDGEDASRMLDYASIHDVVERGQQRRGSDQPECDSGADG